MSVTHRVQSQLQQPPERKAGNVSKSGEFLCVAWENASSLYGDCRVIVSVFLVQGIQIQGTLVSLKSIFEGTYVSSYDLLTRHLSQGCEGFQKLS